MTGSYTHAALEVLYRHLATTDTFPSVQVVRTAINEALAAYEKKIAHRGFRGLLQSESSDVVVKEQGYLITGLVWAFCRTVLPWIYQTYKVLETEAESVYVLDCTCGLGSAVLDASAHDAKGCQGIGQQLRQDCVAEHRVGGSLAYFEAKTSGWAMDNWAPQWETKPQLAIGTFGLKEKYGKEVTENFIVGLHKGSRKTSKPTDPFEEAVTRQESPFCYGYFKPGNPPLAADDWKPSYEWVADDGTTQYARKPYAKEAVWTIAESDWPVWVESHKADPSLTAAEVWVNWLPKSVIEKQVFLVGPLNRQDVQIAALKRQIVGEERAWQLRLWTLYEAQQAGYGWSSEEFQAQLDHQVPASWSCRQFGAKYECCFTDLCFRKSGWEDPTSIDYIARRPHHTTEMLQAIDRGLLPEKSEEDDEDEDHG